MTDLLLFYISAIIKYSTYFKIQLSHWGLYDQLQGTQCIDKYTEQRTEFQFQTTLPPTTNPPCQQGNVRNKDKNNDVKPLKLT